MSERRPTSGRRWGQGPAGTILAAALLAGALPAGAQLPGRLFTTPAERAQLDELRRQAGESPDPEPTAAKPQEPAVPVAPKEPPRPVTMDGLVVRSGGPNTAWVDGQAVLQSQDVGQGLRVDTGALSADGVAVSTGGGRETVRVRPGEVYLPSSRGATPAAGSR